MSNSHGLNRLLGNLDVGHRALVVGGSRGIGLEVSIQLAKCGYEVCVVSRSDSNVQAALDVLGNSSNQPHSGIAVDMSLKGSAEKLVQEMPSGVKVLVVAAGNGSPIQSGTFSSDLESAIQRNFAPVIHSWEACVESLSLRSGSATFISSIAGRQDIDAPWEYSMAKQMVSSFAKLMGRRFPEILVNSVSPGNVLTQGSVWAKRSENPGELGKYLESNVPLKRLAHPSEIAALVTDLAVGRHPFLTGQDLVIDGGQLR